MTGIEVLYADEDPFTGFQKNINAIIGALYTGKRVTEDGGIEEAFSGLSTLDREYLLNAFIGFHEEGIRVRKFLQSVAERLDLTQAYEELWGSPAQEEEVPDGFIELMRECDV